MEWKDREAAPKDATGGAAIDGGQRAHHEDNIGDGRNLLSGRQCSGSHARLMGRHMPASFHHL